MRHRVATSNPCTHVTSDRFTESANILSPALTLCKITGEGWLRSGIEGKEIGGEVEKEIAESAVTLRNRWQKHSYAGMTERWRAKSFIFLRLDSFPHLHGVSKVNSKRILELGSTHNVLRQPCSEIGYRLSCPRQSHRYNMRREHGPHNSTMQDTIDRNKTDIFAISLDATRANLFHPTSHIRAYNV